METIQLLLLVAITILLTWNVFLYFRLKHDRNLNREYFELNAKLNFLTAIGSFAIVMISFLGWDVKDELLKRSEVPIKEMIDEKRSEIDSLLSNKNILKAGIYIITDLKFEENKIFKFHDLLTIDKKHLPELTDIPKLLITTSTGENLRIEKLTNEYFILGKPISKFFYLSTEEGNPKYPKELRFDVWIADYKMK